MAGKQLDLPVVQRVQDGNTADIEPPLDPTWTESEKIAWHAAVAAHDTGLTFRVTEFPQGYNVQVSGPGGGSSMNAVPFPAAWDLINGIAIGAHVASPADRV